MLMADGSFNLPDNVPANEFLNLEDDKISTSRNWAVWLHEYLRRLPPASRMCCVMFSRQTHLRPKDNNFTWKDFQARNNNELVAILGNFVNRAMVLDHKYFAGKVPSCGQLGEMDLAVMEEVRGAYAAASDELDHFKFREALRQAMNVARAGNKYLADTEPWKLWKTEPERVGTILNVALQICANLAVLFEPFTPFL